MADNVEKLTAKQKAFCEEYVKNGYNATQAYLTAYGGQYHVANASGCVLLKKPHVKAYIKEIQKQQFEAACITAERVALKLADIAFAEKGDSDYNTSSQLKALDLLQKQLGIQHQKVEADVNAETEIVIKIGE